MHSHVITQNCGNSRQAGNNFTILLLILSLRIYLELILLTPASTLMVSF